MAAEVTVVFLDQDCDPNDSEDYVEWLRNNLEDQGGITVLAIETEEV
jgi:hypothetical protein